MMNNGEKMNIRNKHSNCVSFHSTVENNIKKYVELSEHYSKFYISIPLLKFDDKNNNLEMRFIYHIENLSSFSHSLTFKLSIDDIKTLSSQSSEYKKELINLLNSLALIEAINYWKLCASKNIFLSFDLSENELKFYIDVYKKGLSEYCYRNGLFNDEINFNDSFVNFIPASKIEDKTSLDLKNIFENNEIYNNLLDDGYVKVDKFFTITPKLKSNSSRAKYASVMVPVGGGKDSIVSLELLRNYPNGIYSFRLNSNQAAKECENLASIPNDKRLNVIRKIDSKLIEFNNQSFLNGHIPFSAILAHIAFVQAKFKFIKYIALSNESSANSSYVSGLDVNHQWSKSYEFENKFREHALRYFDSEIVYFSLLRPYSELIIAGQFSKYTEYHKIFRSCNLGSKNNANSWCANCAKCLFVFIIISSFISFDEVISIFGKNLLNDSSLRDDFERLCGKIPVRPFECVGESNEVRYALFVLYSKLSQNNEDIPLLLCEFISDVKKGLYDDLCYENEKLRFISDIPKGNLNFHTIPDEFIPYSKQILEEMIF